MPFSIAVDYSRSIERCIEELSLKRGNSWISSENLPSRKEGVQKIWMDPVQFFNHIKTKEVLLEVCERGQRTADPRELLAFVERFPQITKAHALVALGYVGSLGDRLVVPFVYMGIIDIQDFEGSWGPSYRFLVASK